MQVITERKSVSEKTTQKKNYALYNELHNKKESNLPTAIPYDIKLFKNPYYVHVPVTK